MRKHPGVVVLKQKNRTGMTDPVCFIKGDQICKPGSVEDGNLSRLNVAIQLQPRCGTRRADAYVPFGVAPDRVYMAMASPSCR